MASEGDMADASSSSSSSSHRNEVLPAAVPLRVSPITTEAEGKANNEEWLELPEDFKPSKFDVIVGWARQNYHHEGNKMLRRLVRENVPRYTAARTKHDKGLIICDILDRIRQESPTGVGLVRQHPQTGRWSYIGNDKAKDKIGHALRKSSREFHKQAAEAPRPSVAAACVRRTSWTSSPSVGTSRTGSLSTHSHATSTVSGGGMRGTIDNNASGQSKLKLYNTAPDTVARSSSPEGGPKPSPVKSSSSSTSRIHHGASSPPPPPYHQHHPPPPSHGHHYHHHGYYPPPHHGYPPHPHYYPPHGPPPSHHHHHYYSHHPPPHHPPPPPAAGDDPHHRPPPGAFQAIHPPPTTTSSSAEAASSREPPRTPVPISSCSSSSFIPPPNMNKSKSEGDLNNVPIREVSVPIAPRPNSVNSNLSSKSSGSSPASLSPQYAKPGHPGPHHPYHRQHPPQKPQPERYASGGVAEPHPPYHGEAAPEPTPSHGFHYRYHGDDSQQQQQRPPWEDHVPRKQPSDGNLYDPRPPPPAGAGCDPQDPHYHLFAPPSAQPGSHHHGYPPVHETADEGHVSHRIFDEVEEQRTRETEDVHYHYQYSGNAAAPSHPQYTTTHDI